MSHMPSEDGYENNFPCLNCITFVMCKSSYMKSGGVMLAKSRITLENKCYLLRNWLYPNGESAKNISLKIAHFHTHFSMVDVERRKRDGILTDS